MQCSAQIATLTQEKNSTHFSKGLLKYYLQKKKKKKERMSKNIKKKQKGLLIEIF